MNAHLESPPKPDAIVARRLRVSGHVQGVGFRPFVYRLAQELGLAGSVRNLNGEVDILAQGPAHTVERFERDLIERAPPLARVRILASSNTTPGPGTEFEILASAHGGRALIHIPADHFTCAACLEELYRPSDRRYRYPFINCTQCGPRYTLIDALPYDRANTTMQLFELCANCREEYEDPSDRRFHAEPVACPDCGPSVWLDAGIDSYAREVAIQRTVALIRDGATVAVKGVGGYHLLCDASNAAAVQRLRDRKRRPHKPLAVMFPQQGTDGLDRVRQEVTVSCEEATALIGTARPIVLLERRTDSTLPEVIAPGLSELGVLLPYSPLHHLILSELGRPVVATSGNLSGEPVLTEVSAARRALGSVADAILHHDRPIARPADDSVIRVMSGRARVLRLGRGLAPLELTLPRTLDHPLIATGGHLKNTVALAWEDRVVLSPHIADMATVRSQEVFKQIVDDLQRLYGVKALGVICDTHPDYATTRWANRCGLPVRKILHHHAHASALAGEHAVKTQMLVFTWDGAGLGDDGALWGGEAFAGMPGAWRRVASLRPFRLPGGERASRSPWRSAAALCWEMGHEAPGSIDPLVRSAWEKNVNCPGTSSVGRLFDGAAALLLGLSDASYEGQGPMMLEAAAWKAGGGTPEHPSLPICDDGNGLSRIDWAPLVNGLLQSATDTSQAAAMVHHTLATTIVEVAKRQRTTTGVSVVGLTGGVFQNALLVELARNGLTREGFEVLLAERVPCGDGGLSYGQVIEAIHCADSRSPLPLA